MEEKLLPPVLQASIMTAITQLPADVSVCSFQTNTKLNTVDQWRLLILSWKVFSHLSIYMYVFDTQTHIYIHMYIPFTHKHKHTHTHTRVLVFLSLSGLL